MALSYSPPGVTVDELLSPSVGSILAAPSTLALIGQTQGYISRTEDIQLTGTDRVALPNFPRDSATLLNVVSVRNINEVTPYDSGKYTVNYDDAVNEIQTVTVSGATGGNFTLTFKSETTAAIAYNASAAAVESALEALSNLDPADVSVAGNSGGPWTITFGGQYANIDLDEVTVDATGLTGGAPAATVHTVANGGVSGTIRRVVTGSNDIPEGASVRVVYTYVPDTYYSATRLDEQSQVEEFYGPAFNASGAINSPISFAAQIAFENGAREIVVQPLFRRTDDTDATSPRREADSLEIQDATTWEQALYSLRDQVDVNVVVPVIGQSFSGLTDGEMLSIFQKIQTHIKYMKDNQQYLIAVLGEDSTTSSTNATAESLRAHATTLRESPLGSETAEDFVFVSPAKFTRVHAQTGADYAVGGQYVAAAIGAMIVSGPVSSSLTRNVVGGFTGVIDVRDKAGKDLDAQSGLTVVEQRGQRLVQIRHSITLDNTSSARREIPVVRAKHRMIESVRDTLENQVIGRVIADGNAPGIVASAVEGVLSNLVAARDLVGYRDVQARTLSLDPTTVEVRFSYRPAFPLNYIKISFSLNLEAQTTTVTG